MNCWFACTWHSLVGLTWLMAIVWFCQWSLERKPGVGDSDASHNAICDTICTIHERVDHDIGEKDLNSTWTKLMWCSLCDMVLNCLNGFLYFVHDFGHVFYLWTCFSSMLRNCTRLGEMPEASKTQCGLPPTEIGSLRLHRLSKKTFLLIS